MGKVQVKDVAEMAGVSYRQMQRIVARYRAGGIEAMSASESRVEFVAADGYGLVSYGATGASAVAATDGA